jgi:hypothetical protein
LTASPIVSKPEPRLLVLAGTRTLTACIAGKVAIAEGDWQRESGYLLAKTPRAKVLSDFADWFVYIGDVGKITIPNTMKKLLIGSLLAGAFVADSLNATAADKKDEKKSEYPLKTCVVSDEKLGEMGKPYVFKHEGREIQLCCESCKKDFKKEPAKYLKKLDAAEKKTK